MISKKSRVRTLSAMFGDPYFWILTVSAFISLSRLYDYSLFSIFQERDIGRALELAKGHMIFFGPEVIGGGHLPGPLYYLLLALPLSLGFGVTGCWYLMTAMASLAVGFTYSSLRRLMSLEISFLTAATLICVPQFSKVVTNFQNYSFMPLFIVLSLGFLSRSFIGETSDRKSSWLMTSFLCALAIQLHMSVVFLILAAFFIQLLGPRMGIKRLPLKTFCLGLCVFSLVVTPYYIWVICRDHGLALGQIPPTFVSLSPANYLSFKRTVGTNYHTRSIFTMISAIAHRKVVWSSLARMLSFSAVAILLVFKFYKPNRPDEVPATEDIKLTQAFRIWLIVALFASLPAATVIMTPHRGRYFSVLLFAATFCVAVWSEKRYRNWPQPCQSVLLIAFSVPLILEILVGIGISKSISIDKFVYLSLATLITFLFFKFASKMRWILALPILVILIMTYRHSDESRGQKGFMFSTARALSDSVIHATGWSWKEARSRIFTLKVQYQRSFGSIYQERYDHFQKDSNLFRLNPPDGYFFMAVRSGLREVVSREELKKRLLKAKLPGFLKRGIRLDEIQLLRPEILPYGILTGYRVLNKLKYPPSFQNLGVNYLASAGAKISPESTITNSAGPKAASVSRMPSAVGPESGIRFTFNDCPNGHVFCDIRFDIVRRPGTNQLKIVISGDVISQTSPWVSPDWLQEIYDSYLKISCERGTPPHEIPLFPAIGVNHGVVGRRVLSQYLLGPAERWIVNPCASTKITQIEAGYRKSRVTVSRSTFYLEARSFASSDFL